MEIILCWIFGHKWARKTIDAVEELSPPAESSCEFCKRCGIENGWHFYIRGTYPRKYQDQNGYWISR